MAKLKGGTRIYGDIKIDGGIYDSSNQVGVAGSVLISTGTGISWGTLSSIGPISQLQVTGISTFTNGPVLIGTATSTGTSGQVLQVAGINSSVYIGGNLGIGTTNPTSKLHVVGDVRVTGVVTASSFSGNASSATYATSSGIATYATSSGIATYATSSGIATYATSSGIATYATSSGIATYATSSGIATYATNAGIATYATSSGIATYATSSGIATYATSSGIATYATSSGVSTSVIGGIGSITQLQVTGISTFTNGPVFIGSGTSTGTSGQVLQVAGINSSVYIGGNLGIGTTNPTSKLHVVGDVRVTGAVYDSTNSPGTSGQILQSTNTGTTWVTASSVPAGGIFDTSIDNALYVQPTGTLDIVGVGTTTTQITTFPAGSNEYIIHSIHVTNISNGDAEISAGFVMNGKRVPASITVGGGPGIHTITVGSASSIVVGMAVTGTGNIGEIVGIGSTAGLQYNTYVTSVDSNNITLSKPLSGIISGTAVFTPVSDVVSRLPVPVGSAVELLKQPFVLNALDSIVLQSTGAGSGIGSTSTAAISQTSGSNFLTVTAGAAITNFIAAGQLIGATGINAGIQANTYVGVGYTPGSLSVPMTRPATTSVASTSMSFTETVVPQDGALQATIVYQSTTDTSYNNGVGLAGTISSVIYGTGPTNSATVQSIRVANVSDFGDYPVWVAIGNTDTIFSYLAYNMVIPKNSNIELCEAPKRLGIGQSIFAFSDTANVIEVQVAGKLKPS